MAEPTKKQLQEALEVATRGRREAGEKGDRLRRVLLGVAAALGMEGVEPLSEADCERIEEAARTCEAQRTAQGDLIIADGRDLRVLRAENDGIIRNIAERRNTTVWLEAIAIALIVLGLGLMAANWKAQQEATRAATQAVEADDHIQLEAAIRAKVNEPFRILDDSPASITATAPPESVAPKNPGWRNVFVINLAEGGDCWIRIVADGQAIEPGAVFKAPKMFTVGAGKIGVRAGCPGRLNYFVNGNQRYPENTAHNPKLLETVELP